MTDILDRAVSVGNSISQQSEIVNVIEISLDNELSKRIAGLSGSEKYNRIRDYIIENIGYEEFELSDGTKAKIDRSDALHIANKSAGKKTAYISQIKQDCIRSIQMSRTKSLMSSDIILLMSKLTVKFIRYT